MGNRLIPFNLKVLVYLKVVELHRSFSVVLQEKSFLRDLDILKLLELNFKE
jgi:hypothetical protein